VTVDAGWSAPFDGPTIVDELPSLLVGSVPDVQGCIVPIGQTQAVRILSDGQSSLDLCVYALLSLGLFRSGGLVKKLSFGTIADWCHDGGPFQVGHSFAIAPDCLRAAPAYCFVQPDAGAEEHAARHPYEAVVALWRRSLFLPTALAPRGPPNRPVNRFPRVPRGAGIFD
jgi:hypothetical protein